MVWQLFIVWLPILKPMIIVICQLPHASWFSNSRYNVYLVHKDQTTLHSRRLMWSVINLNSHFSVPLIDAMFRSSGPNSQDYIDNNTVLKLDWYLLYIYPRIPVLTLIVYYHLLVTSTHKSLNKNLTKVKQHNGENAPVEILTAKRKRKKNTEASDSEECWLNQLVNSRWHFICILLIPKHYYLAIVGNLSHCNYS